MMPTRLGGRVWKRLQVVQGGAAACVLGADAYLGLQLVAGGADAFLLLGAAAWLANGQVWLFMLSGQLCDSFLSVFGIEQHESTALAPTPMATTTRHCSPADAKFLICNLCNLLCPSNRHAAAHISPANAGLFTICG